MGADRICLFNKKLADEIVGHDSESIIKFLTTADSEKVKRVFASYPGFHQLHTPEQLASFIRSYIEEEGIGWLKWELVDTLACSPAFVVDYWGCYAEVFNGHPEGSISSSAYFPQNQEEQFLLLAPQHIDQMLSSLWKHRDDLTAMTGEDIAKLETIKQKCAEDQSFRAAYWFDF